MKHDHRKRKRRTVTQQLETDSKTHPRFFIDLATSHNKIRIETKDNDDDANKIHENDQQTQK